MKKTIIFLLMLMVLMPVSAYDFKSGDLYYNITSPMEPFTVEVTYQEYPSVKNYEGVTAVNIPETVIYNDTTYQVTSIGISAFYTCSSLTEVNIPNSVANISDSAFYQCVALKSASLPEGIMSIAPQTFYECASLTSMTLPNSVILIGESAFCGCTSLENISLGQSVADIGENAFRKCIALKEIAFPNSLICVGKTAFYGCSLLESITLPPYVEILGEKIFEGCTSLSSIVVDEENPVFDSREQCNAVISTYDNTLLFGCQKSTIPSTITTIAKNAFSGCSAITEIIIPNSVTRIEEYAFSLCSSLDTVFIGSGVTFIGDRAFSGCSSLKKVTCEAKQLPQIGYYIFWFVPVANATLYVPESAYEAYKEADQWKSFGTIVPYKPTAITHTLMQNSKPQKIYRDGQILIRSHNRTYNLLGVPTH